MILKRVLALLLIYLTNPHLTPWQWALIQLQFNIPETIPFEFFHKFTLCFKSEVMKKLDNFSALLGVIISNNERVMKTGRKHIVFAIDEAQVLLKNGIDMFLKNREPSKFERPFYSFFMNNLVSLGRPILIAGTSLKLKIAGEFQHGFCKPTGIRTIMHSIFRVIRSQEDSDRFLRRLFKEEVLNQEVLKEAFIQLKGRMRFYTSFATLAPKQAILNYISPPSNTNTNVNVVQQRFTAQSFKSLLNLWIDMYSLVSKYVKSGPRDNRVKDLAQIVAEYWLNSRVAIKDDNFLESLVQSELGMPLRYDNGDVEPEPTLLKAIVNWFHNHHLSISGTYPSHFKAKEAQIFGMEFDDIVALSILELGGKTLADIRLFNEADISFITLSSFKFEASLKSKLNFSEYMKRSDTETMLNKPEASAHPDLAYYMSSTDGQSKILLLFSHKTSQQEKGINGTEIEAALSGLDINSIYIRKNMSDQGQLMQRRNDVFNRLATDFQKGTLKGIIRVLIAIPGYSEKCQQAIDDARNQGSVLVNGTVAIPQCLLVVTEANLTTCGLFHNDLVQFILTRSRKEPKEHF